MEIDKAVPGNVCWAELLTSDAPAAKLFYRELMGWNTHDDPLPSGNTYTMFTLRNRNVCAAYALGEQDLAARVPPHWLSYVAVASTDEVARNAARRGGKVALGPLDVTDVGRMAVLLDPTGAAIAVWQAKKHIGAQVYGEPGALCWIELNTRDTEQAAKFYTEVFGWNAQESKGSAGYLEFWNGREPVGGMMEMNEEWGEVPPHWLPYFAVTHCDESAKRAAKLKGNVRVPPTDIAKVGRFSVISDPQGAAFSIIKLVTV